MRAVVDALSTLLQALRERTVGFATSTAAATGGGSGAARAAARGNGNRETAATTWPIGPASAVALAMYEALQSLLVHCNASSSVLGAVAQHAHAKCRQPPQRGHRTLGPAFLEAADQRVDQHLTGHPIILFNRRQWRL